MQWACTSGVGGRGYGGEVVVEVSQLQCRSLGTQVVQHRSEVAVHGKLGGRHRGWAPHYELLPLPWRTQGGPICHPGPQVVVVGLPLLVGLDWVALYEAYISVSRSKKGQIELYHCHLQCTINTNIFKVCIECRLCYVRSKEIVQSLFHACCQSLTNHKRKDYQRERDEYKYIPADGF